MIHRVPLLIQPKGIGVRGLVTCVLRDATTGAEIRRVGPFRNLYTNAGLDLFSTYSSSPNIFADSGLPAFLAASTDTAAPLAADTVLAGEITPQASNRTLTAGLPATVNAYNNSGSPDFFSVKLTRVFGTTQGNGTIAKLGLFTNSSGPTLLAETLITDAGGTPTTIAKTNSTTLTVTWEFDWIPPQSDTVSTVTVNGVLYTLTSRAANVAAGSAAWGAPAVPGIISLGGFVGKTSPKLVPITALVARTATPVSVGGSVTPTNVGYTPGSFINDYQYVNSVATTAALGLTQDGTVTVSHIFLQIGFSPVIPINQQITIRVPWGRFP